MKASLPVAALLLLSGCCVASAQTTASGVFTKEQATQGEAAYQSHCATCHGFDLHTSESEAPDLTEGPFQYGWGGQTIAERFEKIRSTMPPKKARSLDDQTYLDIVAYILQFNGIPAGNKKLEPDVAALAKIVIVVP